MARARVKLGEIKASLRTRTDGWKVVRQKAPSSPLYTSNPSLKAHADDVIAKGKALDDANLAIVKAEADLAHLRELRDAKAREYDLAYSSLASTAESATTEPGDLLALGLEVRDPGTLALEPPSRVSVGSAPGTGVVDIAVRGYRGRGSFVIEISPDPATEETYTRIAGTGAKRQVEGLAPGLYWVRVALQKAKGQSAFCLPLPVLVR